MKNKVITTNGNIQFVSGDGKVINVSPTQVYSVYGEDNVSFLLVHFHKTSGLALMTSMVSDLELNGQVYSSVSALEDAIADAWSKAGSSLRCEIVDELPTVGQENVIYLVPSEDPSEMNVYSEYIWQNGEFEKLGDTSVQIDLDNYYTKSEVDGLLDDKQDTLQAGRGIDITNDTISFNLPISAGTGSNSIIVSDRNSKATGNYTFAGGEGSSATSFWAFAFGANCKAKNQADVSFGYQTQALGGNSFTVGFQTIANKDSSSAIGNRTRAKNENEFSCGVFNNSVSESTTFGNSGNTLFSVGNGTAENARHNAFEIRQNGDIYISKDGQDIKLQDNLGSEVSSAITSGDTNAVAGGAVYDRFDEVDGLLDEKVDVATFDSTNLVISRSLNDLNTRKLDASAYTLTVDSALDSGSTNPVQNKVLYNKIDEVEQVTAAALNNLNDALNDKQDTLTAGSGITISGNVISAEGGGGKAISAGTNISITTGETADTINCTLPFEKIETNSVTLGGYNNTNKGIYCYFGGHDNTINNYGSRHYIIGDYNKIGLTTSDPNFYHTLTVGEYNINRGGVVFGRYNSSSSDALFSVGNGTADNARHNAFEIRQNGDIYINKDGQDIKLQDQLGGGGSSYTAGDGIDITNDVISVTGKVDTSAITTSVTSASTDSQVPSAKAVYDRFDEVETNLSKKQNKLTAGKSIAISTSNTISLDAAIWKGVSTSIKEGSELNTASAQYSHAEGYQTKATAQNAHAEGETTTASGYASHAEGIVTTASGIYSHSQGYSSVAQGEASHAGGYFVVANNRGEFASGTYNISTSGTDTSKATLFSVGNGTSSSAKHNAFEIKRNGDIYLNDGSKLQDTITATAANTTALGGLKLVKLSQAEYNALATKDNNTLYVIVG